LRIYVSNLSPEVTEEILREDFQKYGSVVSVILAKNRYDNKHRGFGWVEMLRVSEGQDAVSNLNGKILKEHPLVVKAIADWSQAGSTRPKKQTG
jgi:RNA recognition motif-containing protein